MSTLNYRLEFHQQHDLTFNNLIEPVKLIGEGEYIINVLKEIEVTDSYLGLDLDFRKCQNKEPYYNCTTRTYIDTILSECGCLPFNIRISNKVKDFL